jgi:hypothetical protein
MNNTIRPAVGRYSIIRSSENKKAMIHWNAPKFDSKCGRWFESCGYDFASWRDAKYLQEADDLELESFREKHPDIRVKESYCEIEYGKQTDMIEHAWIFLVEYNGSKNRSFCFNVDHVTKHKWLVWERAIRDWHATGEFKTTQFSCYPCSGPWQEN